MDIDNKKEIELPTPIPPTPKSTPVPTKTPTPVSVPVAKPKPKTMLVETLAEDMANVIGGDAGGVVKKIIHSEEEREAEKMNLSPQSKMNKLFMFFSFLLLVGAVATIIFLISTKKTNTVQLQPQFIPLVFTDKSTPLEISGFKPSDITQAVFNEITNTTLNLQGVEGIYLTENKQTIGLRRFITLIKGSFAPDSNTTLVSDGFLMGVVKNKQNTPANSGTGFFILIKVRSASDIFSSLRTWEPEMLTDLHGFFGLNISSTTNYLFSKGFNDGIIQNKNARILYDQKGNIVLMYIFADDNSVVITDSQNAAQEIILRLASSQLQK